MLTRCPNCTTRFRFTPEHAYAAAGRVRCGRCAQIFDAQQHAIALGPPILPTYNATTNTAFHTIKNRQRSSLWKFATGTLILALPLQWAWWERDKLAVDPNIGQLVIQLCQRINCELRPLYAPNKIEVLERNLEQDPSNPEIMQFRLRMVNRAPAPQQLPLLELRLLDSQAQVIGQRRFTPQQYRPTGTSTNELMWPGNPIQARLDLVTSKIEITGYQIDFR